MSCQFDFLPLYPCGLELASRWTNHSLPKYDVKYIFNAPKGWTLVLCPSLIIHPSNQACGGGVYRNHPVRLSVPLFTSCMGHYFIPTYSIFLTFHTIVVHDPRSYFQGQGHSAYIPKICWGHKSSLQCWIWIIFHTIVVHDPSVCLDLDPR